MAVRKDALMKAGMLTCSAITEDIDLAMKLNRLGFKVEQSFKFVCTEVPKKIRTLWKQKMRWNAGFVQCLLNYPKTYLKNPIALIFALGFYVGIPLSIFSILKFILFISNAYPLISFLWNATPLIVQFFISFVAQFSDFVFSIFAALFLFPLFSLPFAFFNTDKIGKVLSVPMLYVFSWLYFPFLLCTATAGLFLAAKKSFALKKKEAGWKGD